MSVQVYFVYETEEDKDRLGSAEISCQGIGILFELYPGTEGFDNPALNRPFVQDLAEWMKQEPVEVDFSSLTEEEFAEFMEDAQQPYVGPTFDPAELIAWAGTWIEIIETSCATGQPVISLMGTEDWIPIYLRDLKDLVKQGECAQHHGLRLHIEMY